MALLLVSVRSAEEAQMALHGGASIIDVKEPSAGALGCASIETWRAVRGLVPAPVPVSVALGELTEWADRRLPLAGSAWGGLAYRKVGLAGSGPGWRADLSRLVATLGGETRWIAVAYSDWERAAAPEPDEVLDAALGLGISCVGLLVDTWEKVGRKPIDPAWRDWIDRAHAQGHFVALAGGLDLEAISRLDGLGADIIAVRGAACRGGDRRAPIDPVRVKELAIAAVAVGTSSCRRDIEPHTLGQR